MGALKDREEPPSPPEGGVGNLCLKSSSMLLCSLRFRPYRHINTEEIIRVKKKTLLVCKTRAKCKTKVVLVHNNRSENM